VRDRGCGIPPSQLERIWEPYVTTKQGGTGLGLAIARQTVLAHGGVVDAASAEGQGTEIRFVIPVDGTDRPRPVEPEEATSPDDAQPEPELAE
jgi:signal transduction histidine kinase